MLSSLINKFCADKNISGPVMSAIVISVISLALSAGVMRWSWLLLDEQIRLRQDFMRLKNQQDQVNIQYEAWLKKVQQEINKAEELQKHP